MASVCKTASSVPAARNRQFRMRREQTPIHPRPRIAARLTRLRTHATIRFVSGPSTGASLMASDFITIPDWFSFENQGAGVALADLTGAGARDLIVLMVDNPPGLNRGLYRVGKNLAADGTPAGGWTPWMEIPDWFSFENQGAGVAVADLDGDGRPELIVFMIDNPPGQNQGYYRVGSKLDANGAVTGGWGDWTPIPDWFSFENQDGGVAVADLDGDGRPELIVFMIDNPPGKNQGKYRVGRKLDAAGAVTDGWTDWQDVPDWFSFENQAGSLTVADLGTGTLDIIVYQVDNPPGINQGFYKVGKKLDADGHVAKTLDAAGHPQDDWGFWTVLPGWFSAENAGGGVAVLEVDGKHELITMFIDNPPGQNAGIYRLLDLDVDPPKTGIWEDVPFTSEVLAVHAAVLHTGKVMFFSGSGNVAVRHDSPDFGSIPDKIYTSVVWDPTVTPSPGGDENYSHPDTIRGDDGKVFDFFCGGDTFLADGRLLSAGGTEAYPGHVSGRSDAVIFDPGTQQWSRAAHMAHGRWYPTLVTLGDGRVLAVSGLDVDGNLNTTVEVYSPDANTWQALHLPGNFPGLPLYAHLLLMEDGRLLFTGGSVEGPDVALGPCLIDIAHAQVGLTPLAGLRVPESRKQSASVLLPPVQDQKAMIIGGGIGDEGIVDATAAVDVIDLRAATSPLHGRSANESSADARECGAPPGSNRARHGRRDWRGRAGLRLPSRPRSTIRRTIRGRWSRLPKLPASTILFPCCCPTDASSRPAETLCKARTSNGARIRSMKRCGSTFTVLRTFSKALAP